MVQEFLTAWINWYYGDDAYPTELQDRLTYQQRMECLSKTEQIKKIIGNPKVNNIPNGTSDCFTRASFRD